MIKKKNMKKNIEKSKKIPLITFDRGYLIIFNAIWTFLIAQVYYKYSLKILFW
jgi:hypothetical protein